jgi:hypothetical protein
MIDGKNNGSMTRKLVSTNDFWSTVVDFKRIGEISFPKRHSPKSRSVVYQYQYPIPLTHQHLEKRYSKWNERKS